MKYQSPVEIIELHELEDDYLPTGSRCGYYTEGHINRQWFAICCNKEFDLAALDSPVYLHEVKQGYLKKTEYEDDSGKYEVYITSEEYSFPATYIFF